MADDIRGLGAAADRLRGWFRRRLDDQALDVARLYRTSRDRFTDRLRLVYEQFLGEEPSLQQARLGPAGPAMDAAVAQTVDQLSQELGQMAVDRLLYLHDAQPRQLNRILGTRAGMSWAEVPASTQKVLGELTTRVVGGGTFMDRLTHQSEELRHDLYGTLKQGLLNGDDFKTVRDRVHKAFGVETLDEPDGPAYGSVKQYEMAARKSWNDLMTEKAEETDALSVWWATLDERTTPGCVARHGRTLAEIGEVPPRHPNCRCVVLPVPPGTDRRTSRADADDWLSAHGWTRRQAAREAARFVTAEFDPGKHPRDPEGKFSSGGGHAAGTPAEDDAPDVARQGGATFNGVQRMPGTARKYAVLTDPETLSTTMIPWHEFTPDAVRDAMQRMRAKFARTSEGGWTWGADRLVPLYHARPDTSGERFSSLPWRDLPALVVGTAAPPAPVATVAEAQRQGAPDHVLLNNAGRGWRVLTEWGWRPIAGRLRESEGSSARWIETARGYALDSPDAPAWDEEVRRFPLDLVNAFPEMRRVTFPALRPGEWCAARVMAPEAAEAATLGEGLDASAWTLGQELDGAVRGALYNRPDESAPTLVLAVLETPTWDVAADQIRSVVALQTGEVVYAADPFSGNLVAPYQRAAAAVMEPDGRVWAIRPRGRMHWTLPGGHLDPGETAARAAERETREEAGVKARAVRFLGRLYRPWSTTEVFLAERVGDPGLPTTGDEIDAALAVPLEWLEPADRVFLAKHLGTYAGISRDISAKVAP
jgi:8-oxo-dGTP pyrophosphatase MutT (NUDIX family)